MLPRFNKPGDDGLHLWSLKFVVALRQKKIENALTSDSVSTGVNNKTLSLIISAFGDTLLRAN